MAVVREFTCPNGVKVRIHDDYLPDTPEENARRIRRLWDIAYQILARHEREKEEKHESDV